MKNLTPEHLRCPAAYCPSVHELDDGRLLIVGEYVSTNEVRRMGANPNPETEGGVIIDRALLANISLPLGDYGELVERLRAMRGEEVEPGYVTYDPLCQEAADAIAFLQREVGRLTGALELILDGAQGQGAFTGMSWLDVEKIAKAALSQHPGDKA